MQEYKFEKQVHLSFSKTFPNFDRFLCFFQLYEIGGSASLHSSQASTLSNSFFFTRFCHISVTLCLFILKIKFSKARINYASRNYKTSAEYSSALSPLRSSIACTQIPSPSTACFRTLLFLPVNPTKEIRVAFSISNVSLRPHWYYRVKEF